MSNYWRDRSVLVTGAGGFVGSHLVEALALRGARVTAWVRAGSGGHGWRLVPILDTGGFRIDIQHVDVGDGESVHAALNDAFRSTPPSVIFHLAAQAHVGESWKRPHDSLRTNIDGTFNLLKDVGVRKWDGVVKRIVVAGSSEEYGGVATGQNDAHSPLAPRSLYAFTKVAQDGLAMMYWRAQGLPCIVARANNIYGPAQGARYLTPTILTQALEWKHVKLGSGDARRDFTYVGDAVDAYLALGESGTPGETYTWGWGTSWSVREWAAMGLAAAAKAQGHPVTNYDVQFDVPGRGRPATSEVSDLVADPSRIRMELGWEPKVDPVEGLRRTAMWYAEPENRPWWLAEVDWR